MASDFSEKTLEDIIFENKDIIHEKGFEVLLSNTYRQFVLPSGKKIDILSFERDRAEILFYIIELKKDRTDNDALIQAYGYLDEFLMLIKPAFEIISFKVILVGKEVTNMPIANFLASPTETYSFKYGINGPEFKMCYSNCNVVIDGRKIRY